MNEVWKPIENEVGYEVSDRGRVRSLDRTIETARGPWRVRGRVLSPVPNTSGHLQVRVNGRLRQVHRLVLEAFIGPCPPPLEALHRDDDPSNNSITNLRWGTRSENVRDGIRNGRNHNANKTTCKRGHPLEGNNLIRTPRGTRECRTCRRERQRK